MSLNEKIIQASKKFTRISFEKLAKELRCEVPELRKTLTSLINTKQINVAIEDPDIIEFKASTSIEDPDIIESNGSRGIEDPDIIEKPR